MTWHRMDDFDNPPPDATHVRGLWVHSAHSGKRLYWHVDAGFVDDDGDFITSSGDPTGWLWDDYTHWAPLLAPPEGEE